MSPERIEQPATARGGTTVSVFELRQDERQLFWMLHADTLEVVVPGGVRLPLYIRQSIAGAKLEWDDDNVVPIVLRPFVDVRVTLWPVPLGGNERYVAVLAEHFRQRRSGLLFKHFKLSPREIDVVALMLSGLEVEQIATRLGVSATTVRDYFKRALAKTGAKNRLHMAALVLGFETINAPERPS